MYLNKFKTLAKNAKSKLDYNTLSEAQVDLAKLLNFKSVNAVSASLIKATGLFDKNQYVSNVPNLLPLDTASKEHRLDAELLRVDDGIIEELSGLMMSFREDLEHLRTPCASIIISNEEYVIKDISYEDDTGFKLELLTVAKALYEGKVETTFKDNLSSKFFDHIDCENRKQRNLIRVGFDNKYSGHIDTKIHEASVRTFNSEVLHAISPRPEVALNKTVKELKANFGTFTFNDFIKMSEGIEDQPLLLTDGLTADGYPLVCEDVCMIEGSLAFSTYHNSYSSHRTACENSNGDSRKTVPQILFWKEAIEVLKQQPKHLLDEPVLVYFFNDYMMRKYTVPLGVTYRLPCQQEGELCTGLVKIVKPMVETSTSNLS